MTLSKYPFKFMIMKCFYFISFCIIRLVFKRIYLKTWLLIDTSSNCLLNLKANIDIFILEARNILPICTFFVVHQLILLTYVQNQKIIDCGYFIQMVSVQSRLSLQNHQRYILSQKPKYVSYETKAIMYLCLVKFREIKQTKVLRPLVIKLLLLWYIVW